MITEHPRDLGLSGFRVYVQTAIRLGAERYKGTGQGYLVASAQKPASSDQQSSVSGGCPRRHSILLIKYSSRKEGVILLYIGGTLVSSSTCHPNNPVKEAFISCSFPFASRKLATIKIKTSLNPKPYQP